MSLREWICYQLCGARFFNRDASREIDRLTLEVEALRRLTLDVEALRERLREAEDAYPF